MLQLLTLRAIGASALILVAVACGGTAVSEITGPDIVRCQTTLSAPQSPVPATGAQLSLAVGAARECEWTARSEASWIRVSPASGQGEATVTLAIDQNGAATARNGAIVINDARITLAQDPAPCRYELNRSNAVVSHTGGTTSVGLATLDGCEWRASTSASWVHIVNASGRNSTIVTLEVAPNIGGQRTGDVTIAGLHFTIQQDVAPPAPAPPGPTPPPTSPAPPAPSPPAPPPTAPTPPAPPPTTPTPPVPPPTIPPTPPLPGPPTGSHFETKGTVSAFSGSCPAVTFELSGTTIVTDRDTRFEDSSCRSLRNGRRVEVKGVYLSDGRVLAERVKRLDDDDDDDDDDDPDGH